MWTISARAGGTVAGGDRHQLYDTCFPKRMPIASGCIGVTSAVKTEQALFRCFLSINGLGGTSS